MTRLILVRHGETVANREFRYIGRRDDALSERGVAQAKQLAEALAMLPIAAVYSSPLQRAYQTALPIAAGHGLEVRKADDLCEGDFGLGQGSLDAFMMLCGSIHLVVCARLICSLDAMVASSPFAERARRGRTTQ